SSVVAMVVRPVRGRTPPDQPDPALRLAIGRALDQVRRSALPRQSLQLVRPDHGLFVVAGPVGAAPAAVTRSSGVQRLAVALQGATQAAVATDLRAVVGISDPFPRLADVNDAYKQALQTAQVCGIIQSFGPVAGWWQL